MAKVYRELPRVPVSPMDVGNDNYQYLQSSVETLDAVEREVFSDTPAASGIYLYEVRVIGIQNLSEYATFKRSFTLINVSANLNIVTQQSDYTFRTDATWTVTIVVEGNALKVKVRGDSDNLVKWVATIIKTINPF